MSSEKTAATAERALDLVRRVYGYDSLRPLQHDAIEAGLAGRDSVVVLPTGGGKSLCYQVPAILAGGTDVVVSPLLSLMKDQVDALTALGVPAAALNSTLTAAERREVRRRAEGGEVRLLFVSPERLVTEPFLDFLAGIGVRAFAVDEAHCISHWGHDFRPEYRRLRTLRERFPGVAIHAFTATATERVRNDVAEQLGLADPVVLVGSFDRENLLYRVLPRTDAVRQTIDVLSRHRGDAAIVYCIARKEVESLAEHLRAAGIRAAAYHAGMDKADRDRTQDEFAAEKIDVVVATVAFGMGIDKSDVRCVVHASLPKSVEHYQQETGRAGRDGLPAECVLLYSPADALKWESLIDRSAAGAEDGGDEATAARELLSHIARYGEILACRHRFLARYFGQEYGPESCGNCDVCLGEVEPMEGSTEVAQKVLSCVARVGGGFGVGHVVKILKGASVDAVRARGHDRLSTFGLLADRDEKSLTNIVYQLVGQGLLDRTPGDRPVLKLTRDSIPVLKGTREVLLREPKVKRVTAAKADAESWEGVDRALFEHLREVRRRIATERGVPAYIVFDDRTLRNLAKARPATPAEMGRVRGVGEKKLADFGPVFLAAIAAHQGGGARNGG